MRTRFLDRHMLSRIFALAWPTMLEEFMQTAVQYIDTAMVGRLGTEATAAVGATSTVNWLIGSTVSALGVGFLALIAQARGAGNTEKAKSAAAQACTVTLIAGLLFTMITVSLSPAVPVWMQVDPAIRPFASGYFAILYAPMLFRAASIILGTVLRAAGDTRTPMRVGILVNAANVVLNFFLIYETRQVFGVTVFGAGLGVHGAALASAVAYALGGTLIFLALWRHPDISPRGRRFSPDKAILTPCFRVAMPNMVQRFGTSLGYVVFASLINALGGTSTAAHTIANTVESAFYIPGWGMQTAAATLAGFAFGAKNRNELKRLGNAMLPLEIGLMIVSGALLFLFAEPLVRLFSADESVIALSTRVLKMVAVSEPFYGVPIVVEGMMQGCGDTKLPLLFSLAGMWGVRILGTFVTTRLLSMGLVSAWGCMIGHNLLLFVLFGMTFISGRWMRNLDS